ncbi:MAG: SDR family oxidoreductase [Sandaracinaceae bacterium]
MTRESMSAPTPLVSIPRALKGRHLLVTGFTGFVGKVWVTHLLDELPEIGRLTLIVRKRRSQSGLARVRRIVETSPALRPLRDRYGADLGDFLRARVAVVEGDVSLPDLGLDPATLAALAPEVDAVVHCAGLTDFAPDPVRAVEVNVHGARHAADVAARTRGRRLIHVSTAFVAGMVSGEVPETTRPGVSPNGTRFDPEGELLAMESACSAIGGARPKSPESRRARIEMAGHRARALGWPNVYTYSKGLAEQFLIARDDIELTLVRPSIVECALEFPFPGWNEGLNTSGPIVWMVTGYAWKVPMRAENRFDVVPVDKVVRGMTIAVADALSGRAAPVYQLASSHQHPFTFGRALDLCALAVRTGYTPSDVSAVERFLLIHLDATALDKPAEKSFWVPAARHTTKLLRDRLLKADVRRLLPRDWAPQVKDRLQEAVREAGLRVNRTHNLIKTVEGLWKVYQPFIHDFDYQFRADHVSRTTQELSDDERARFGWTFDDLDWRDYWINVEVPGLDTWSLPLLRGKEVPEDEGFDLGVDLPGVGAAPARAGAEVRLTGGRG